MKKLSLLLAALAITATASAGVNLQSRGANGKINKLLPNNAKIENVANRFALPAEHPAGELKTYLRGGEGLIYNQGVSAVEQSGKVFIVFAEDGETVYIQDIVSGLQMGAWVEGHIVDGNMISVPLGQSLGTEYDWWTGDTYEYNLAWGTTYFYDEEDENGEMQHYIGMAIDDRATEALFEIDGDVITLVGSDGDITQEGEDAYVGTGLAAVYGNYENAWTGNLDWKSTYTLTENYQVHEMITEQPAGELVQYHRSGGYVGYNQGWTLGEATGKINIVWGADGAVYMQDPMSLYSNFGTWIKGTVEDNILTFPLGQYIYDDLESEYSAYIVWGTLDVDAEGYLTETVDENVTEVQFALDPENGSLTLLNSYGNPQFDEEGYLIMPDTFTGLMMWNDEDGCYEVDYNTVYTEVHVVPATPADPTNVRWNDYGDEDGYNSLRFTLPTTDVDGNPIETEYLSYSVFIDRGNGPELFTFTADEYSYDLTEDMTEIPYEIFSNAWDFYTGSIYFYHTFEGLVDGYDPFFTHNIGIQVYYTVNGEKRASNIVWAFDPNTAVEEVNATKTVANVRYFNVAGQEMAQPSGMTIQVTTYTDGTKSAVKVMK